MRCPTSCIIRKRSHSWMFVCSYFPCAKKHIHTKAHASYRWEPRLRPVLLLRGSSFIRSAMPSMSNAVCILEDDTMRCVCVCVYVPDVYSCVRRTWCYVHYLFILCAPHRRSCVVHFIFSFFILSYAPLYLIFMPHIYVYSQYTVLLLLLLLLL